MSPSYKGAGRNATTGPAKAFVSGRCPPGNTVLAILRRDVLVDHAADRVDHGPSRPRLGGGMGRHIERGELLRGLLGATLQRISWNDAVKETGGDRFRRADHFPGHHHP